MMMILMVMILKLLLVLDLWLGVTDINNARHVKKYKQKISACSIASNTTVGMVYPRRQKKRNSTIFN